MARVSEGCATLHSSAARVKLSVRATARKKRTWCISIEPRPTFLHPLCADEPGDTRLVSAFDTLHFRDSPRTKIRTSKYRIGESYRNHKDSAFRCGYDDIRYFVDRRNGTRRT